MDEQEKGARKIFQQRDRKSLDPENVFYISVTAIIITKIVCNTLIRITVKK